ncbi:universal stress protein [Gordonia sp. Z-3]|jgi:nucleotide-binding universal stress UspA family protein|uniref:universal stress protein n=1 Tax=Gordonia sp. Z-3 TaxID=3115408 RepID=UPI002E2BFACC|nr:universal stress protein [Gordonia sp. Z-3]MED5800024.1 universal stress protein [Gordonia sp. Z-3]
MNATFAILFVIAWLLAGLLSALWLARHGHSPMWIPIGLVLGPFFALIALDRASRHPELVAGGPPDADAQRTGPRVMVGIDGSAESEHALATAVDIAAARRGTVTLAEVLSYDDVVEGDSTPMIETATRRLAEVTGKVAAVPAEYEILVGPPGEALRDFADKQDADLIVVGRHGRGFSERLLGSVSADVVAHSTVPVLVVEPHASRTESHPVTHS